MFTDVFLGFLGSNKETIWKVILLFCLGGNHRVADPVQSLGGIP